MAAESSGSQEERPKVYERIDQKDGKTSLLEEIARDCGTESHAASQEQYRKMLLAIETDFYSYAKAAVKKVEGIRLRIEKESAEKRASLSKALGFKHIDPETKKSLESDLYNLERVKYNAFCETLREEFYGCKSLEPRLTHKDDISAIPTDSLGSVFAEKYLSLKGGALDKNGALRDYVSGLVKIRDDYESAKSSGKDIWKGYWQLSKTWPQAFICSIFTLGILPVCIGVSYLRRTRTMPNSERKKQLASLRECAIYQLKKEDEKR